MRKTSTKLDAGTINFDFPRVRGANDEDAFVVEGTVAFFNSVRAYSESRHPTAKNPCLVALCGGTTPLGVYESIALNASAETEIDWTAVKFCLLDERYVLSTNKEYNGELIISKFVVEGSPFTRHHFVLVDTSLDYETAAADYEARLNKLNDHIGVAMVGMGSDGHVASWSPGSTFSSGGAPIDVHCAKISTHEVPERITLGLMSIRNADTIIGLVMGAARVGLLYNALCKFLDDANSAHTEPVLICYLRSHATIICSPALTPEYGNPHIVIAGATGNLARTKLFPAMYHLFLRSHTYEKAIIHTYSRTHMNHFDIAQAIKKYSPAVVDSGALLAFLLRVMIHQCKTYGDDEAATILRAKIEGSSILGVKIIVGLHLAIPPSAFLECVRSLKRCLNLHKDTIATRFAVEKPFGNNWSTACSLFSEVDKCLNAQELFLIDHYLMKPAVESLCDIRYNNCWVRSAWNDKPPTTIFIRLSERIDCRDRTSYYNECGVVQDVIQNHVLQILSYMLMEEPVSKDDIPIKKAGALLDFGATSALLHHVYGQYDEFLNHLNANNQSGTLKHSITPTYALLVYRTKSDVKIIIEAGKALMDHVGEVRVLFEHPSYFRQPESEGANNESQELRIQIQPDTKVEFDMNVLDSQNNAKKVPLTYSFDHSSEVEPYSKMYRDLLLNDKERFATKDELLNSWKIVDSLPPPVKESLVIYSTGCRRPGRAQQILESFGLR